MKSERDIEHLLDAWFEHEARPMPSLLLEAVLEELPRVSRRRARPWLGLPPVGQRLVGVAVAGAVVIAAVVLGPGFWREILPAAGPIGASPVPTVSPSPPASPGLVWDPAADWRRFPSQRNPSPDGFGNPNVWSYAFGQRAADPASLTLLPSYAKDGEQWFAPGRTNLFIAYSGQGVSIHPYAENPSVVQDPVLVWRAPVAGTVAVTGSVTLVQGPCVEQDAHGIVFLVDEGRRELYRIVLPAGGSEPFSLTAVVQPGDELLFEVDPGIDARCDATELIVRITTR